MLQLEILSNELLLYIYKYLSTADLIHAFSGLNSRFDYLVYAHLRNDTINFQSILKEDFDVVCQKYLPVLSDYIISLHLSNDDETPKLCELFLSYGFTLDRFIHLKSLSIYYINSSDTINQMIDQCHHLMHLNRLSLIDCEANKWMESTIINIINNIWSLSKLTHCTINDIALNATWLAQISVISSSIEYLFIGNVDNSINILHHLFEFIPRLQRLTTKWFYQRELNDYRSVFSSLISFKTCFRRNSHLVTGLIQSMPNLCYLTLDIHDSSISGYDWKKLIVNYLPKLKIFRLKMTFNFSNNDNIYERTDELIDSFRTSFWIEQHQWYVRCDCYYSNQCAVGTLLYITLYF